MIDRKYFPQNLFTIYKTLLHIYLGEKYFQNNKMKVINICLFKLKVKTIFNNCHTVKNIHKTRALSIATLTYNKTVNFC